LCLRRHRYQCDCHHRNQRRRQPTEASA
jgi:hypothetical protein